MYWALCMLGTTFSTLYTPPEKLFWLTAAEPACQGNHILRALHELHQPACVADGVHSSLLLPVLFMLTKNQFLTPVLVIITVAFKHFRS